MTRLCLLLVGFAQALAWGPTAPMLRSSFAQQASLRSVRGQRTLTNLKMDAGRDVSVDRRGTISLFTLGLVSLLSPAQSWADGKSSTELQKEVANLEREVETFFKDAKSKSESAAKTFTPIILAGNVSATKFSSFASQGAAASKYGVTLKNQSSAVITRLEKDEDLLGEQAVDKYEEAKAMGKKGGDKGSTLLAEGSELKKKARGKIDSQKNYARAMDDMVKDSATIVALGSTNAVKGVGLQSKSRIDAMKAMEVFQKGVKNMGDVKLFNDNGKMANATQPLKMLKEAIALMATAEKDSKAAYDEIKKIAGKATQTKANLDKTIAKSQIGLQEVDKDGKASDETLKRFSASLNAAMSAVVESESKAKELNDGLRNVLANMKEAEVKFAAADKSGIKSDEVYALVTTTVKKEQDDLAKYRKKRLDATKKLAPPPPPEPGPAPKAVPPPPAPAATPTPAARPVPPPSPAVKPPPSPAAPVREAAPPPQLVPKDDEDDEDEAPKPVAPKAVAPKASPKPAAAPKASSDDAFDLSQYLK